MCVFVSPIYIYIYIYIIVDAKIIFNFFKENYTPYLININVTFQNIIALGKYILRCLLYIIVEELNIGMT